MFYSHEVLTSRKYGVATIWLVATLGSKSTLRKVSRKAILDVDVEKACETIVEPDAPMALRLQSNLLYGVTRVYAQQCGYVLTDAESARNSMRAMLKVVQHAELEPVGGNKGRADQLLLQDDPNFLPDLDLLPTDLENLAKAINLDDETHLSLARDEPLSQMATQFEQSIEGLMIPPSTSSSMRGAVGGIDLFHVRGDSGPGTAAKIGPRLLDDDLGLIVDADGTLRVEGDLVQQSYPQAVRESHTEVQSGGARGKDYGEPAIDHGHDRGMHFVDDSNLEGGDTGDNAPVDGQNEGTTESAQLTLAAVRRRVHRQPPVLSMDENTALRNGDIARLRDTYLERMRDASRRKQSARLTTIAKNNAEQWVLGGRSLCDVGMPAPLDIFAGTNLVEAFTGTNLRKGQKRKLEDADGSEGIQPKRLRTDLSPEEAGRCLQQDDGYGDFMGDDPIEQGREQPTPLDDRQLSSIFPWIQSAGSRRPTDAHQPTSTSFGGGLQLNILGHRGSRLTSASPLTGRGRINGELYEGSQLPPGDTDLSVGGIDRDDDFELYEAATQVDTQPASPSQWQYSVLAGESVNFLEFVQSAMDEADESTDRVDFETLLPPESNSRMVAAQALLHVLALGTRSALKVDQETPFSMISLRVMGNVRQNFAGTVSGRVC